MKLTQPRVLLTGFFLSTIVFTAPVFARHDSTKLQVITSGGFSAAFDLLKPEFERETGIEIQTSHGSSTGGAKDSIPERLKRGEKFDVIILSRHSLNQRTKAGYVYPATRTDLVESKIGMSVKAGAPKPDISTPEAFIHTLKSAKSIGYSASASGTYLSTKLWPDMGIWKTIQPKSQRILSERVASVVARGDVEIGFQQISEILPIPGAEYAGQIPDKYQKVTTFSAGIIRTSQKLKAAERLIDYLSSNRVAKTIRQTGLFPVIRATTLATNWQPEQVNGTQQ